MLCWVDGKIGFNDKMNLPTASGWGIQKIIYIKGIFYL